MLIRLLRRSLLLITVLLIFTSSCSLIPRYSQQEKEALLISNLHKFDTFRITGIVEVNYKIFSFRKNIILKKNQDQLRADIVDSGIFGLSPTPFISAYYDSLLMVRFSKQEDLLIIPQDELAEGFPYFNYLLDLGLLLDHKELIIKDHQLEMDGIIFHFSENMELVKIERSDNSFLIQLNYNTSLEEILFFKNDKLIADIIIDKITFSEVNISKLTN